MAWSVIALAMTSAGDERRPRIPDSKGKVAADITGPHPSPTKRGIDKRDELNTMQDKRDSGGAAGQHKRDEEGLLLATSQDVPQLGRGMKDGMVELEELGEPPAKILRVSDDRRGSSPTPEDTSEEAEDIASVTSEASGQVEDDDSRAGGDGDGNDKSARELPPLREGELEMWVDMCAEKNRKAKSSLRSKEIENAGCFGYRLLVYPCGTNECCRNALDYSLGAFLEIVPPEKRGLGSEPGRYFPDHWSLRFVNFTISLVNFKRPEKSAFRQDRKAFTYQSSDCGWRNLVHHDCRSSPGISKLMDEGWLDNHGRFLIRAMARPLRLGVESSGNRPDLGGPIIPYLGLENLGATCYLNGLLQSLFLIPQFRRIVYCSTLAADTGKLLPQPSSPSRSTSNGLQIVLALQSVFFQLERGLHPLETPPPSESSRGMNGRVSRASSEDGNGSSKAVSSEALVRAFGWDTADLFTQQDAQELSRLLCDKLEEMLKPSKSDKLIRDLFVGKLENYIECMDVDYKSTKEEVFYDLQLNVLSLTGEPLGSVEDSLKEYFQTEVMDGDDKYEAEGYGKQRAKKGLRLLSMPPVFTVQLKRFCFSMDTMDMQKVNEYFQFGDVLDMSPYLYEPPSDPADSEYVLHTVLVHNGNVYGGHYYAFVRPELGQSGGEDKWYRFDDENVTRVSKEAAVDDNFGGPSPVELDNPFVASTESPKPFRSAGRRSSLTSQGRTYKTHSAYILVYIRRSALDWVMKPCSLSEVNPHLYRRLLASTNTPTSTSSNPSAKGTSEEGSSPEGEPVDQLFDVSVVCLSNISLVQLLSHQGVWNPATVVDQVMDALVKNPNEPGLPAGTTHTIVSSGTLVDNLPNTPGIRHTSAVPNGGGGGQSPPSQATKIYQLGRVDGSPSSNEASTIKFTEVIGGYFLGMCLPRSACREHPLAGQVPRPVMIMMLADEKAVPKLEVPDQFGRKSVAGIHLGRKSRLVILRYFDIFNSTLNFITTATITPSPAGMVRAARYILNSKYRRDSETGKSSVNLEERTDWKMFLERNGVAIEVDALGDMKKSGFNDVLGRYERNIADGEVIVVQWYEEGANTLPDYFEVLKHSAPVSFVVHDPFTPLHGPGVMYAKETDMLPAPPPPPPPPVVAGTKPCCSKHDMLVDVRIPLYDAIANLVTANRDSKNPSPLVPAALSQLPGCMLYMYPYDPFMIPLESGAGGATASVRLDLSELAKGGGEPFSTTEPFAHPTLHLVFLQRPSNLPPEAMPLMCRAFDGPREIGATVVWPSPEEKLTEAIGSALDALKEANVTFATQSGIRAMVTTAPCQGTSEHPQRKIIMLLDSEDPSSRAFEDMRVSELPCADKVDIFSGRVDGNYLRIEESVEKKKNEEVIPVVHATRNGSALFGHIFFVNLPCGPISGSEIQRRISEKLGVSETELARWRLLHSDTTSCTFIKMDDTQVDVGRWRPLESSTLILRHQPPAESTVGGGNGGGPLADRPLHLG